MDNLHAVKSASRSDSRGPDQPSTPKTHYSNCAGEASIICELSTTFHITLQVKDDSTDTSGDSPSDEDGNSSLEDGNTSNSDLKLDGPSTMSSACSHICATFPPSGSEGKDPESQLENKGCTCSMSVPSARRVVSAMKGSRAKEGVPLKKLSVSWAPDVYDPPPTSISHFPRKRSQQHKSSKKHGKGKQKGKSTRGGGSAPKDKKHYRKMGGRSGRCSDSYTNSEQVNNYKPSLELLGYKDVGDSIGTPDPNCGSSFLGQASGTMHCVY